MELQVGVKVLLKNQDGKYLILKRAKDKYSEIIRMWDFVGGRIDPGTPLIDNLKREINEETKLELIGEPKLIAAQDILRIAGRHVVRLTYIGETEGEPVLDDEHEEYRWLTLEEVRAFGDELDFYAKEVMYKYLI